MEIVLQVLADVSLMPVSVGTIGGLPHLSHELLLVGLVTVVRVHYLVDIEVALTLDLAQPSISLFPLLLPPPPLLLILPLLLPPPSAHDACLPGPVQRPLLLSNYRTAAPPLHPCSWLPHRQQVPDDGLALLIWVPLGLLGSCGGRSGFGEVGEAGHGGWQAFAMGREGGGVEVARVGGGLWVVGGWGEVGGAGEALDAVGDALVLGHLAEVDHSKYRNQWLGLIIVRFRMSSKLDEQLSYATHKKHTIKFKVVFVGDQSVGKSSIINRFIKNEFDSTHNPTVGIDFVSKNIAINERSIRLQLWDTAGQERFKSLIPGYLRDSHAIFIVYDVTSRESYDNLSTWLDYVKEHRGEDVIIYIIANKADAAEERTVSREEAEERLKLLGVHFIEASAKTGQNLQQLFTDACNQLLKSSQLETTVTHMPGIKEKKMIHNIPGEKSRPANKEPAEAKPSATVKLNEQPLRGSKLIRSEDKSGKVVKQKNCC